MSLDDGLSCPVCWHDFNDAENTPYVLWCGHSLCKACVFGMNAASINLPFTRIPLFAVHMPFFIACPWCQFLSLRVSWKGALQWPRKNFFLLWVVDSHRGVQHWQQRPCIDSCSPPADSQLVSGAVPPSTRTFESLQLRQIPAMGRLDTDLGRQNHYLHDIDLALEQTRAFLLGVIRGVGDVTEWSNLVTRGAGRALHLALKLPFILLFVFIVLYVLPFSTLVLALYVLLTILLALPSVLVMYLAYPSLEWLAREIAVF